MCPSSWTTVERLKALLPQDSWEGDRRDETISDLTFSQVTKPDAASRVTSVRRLR
jgi:hypothetical protein